MEKIGFAGQPAEKKFDIQYLEEKDLERVSKDLRAVAGELVISFRNPETYVARIKNIEYTASQAAISDEENVRYDITAFRKDKDGGWTMIAGTPPYTDSAAAEEIYHYLRALYHKKQGESQ